MGETRDEQNDMKLNAVPHDTRLEDCARTGKDACQMLWR